MPSNTQSFILSKIFMVVMPVWWGCRCVIWCVQWPGWAFLRSMMSQLVCQANLNYQCPVYAAVLRGEDLR